MRPFLSLLFAVLALFYLPFVLGQKSFYGLDISILQEPGLQYIGDSLRHYRFPLWNQYICCGMPELSVRYCSPTNIFELPLSLLPFNTGYALAVILDQFIAGAGAYLFVSTLGWGGIAAIFAGTTYALSSLMFSLQQIRPMLTAAAWLPLAAWALLKLSKQQTLTGRVWWCILSAIFVFILITSGALDVAFLELVLLLVWFITDLAGPSEGRVSRLQLFGFRALALVTGALLSGPYLLPVLEAVMHSPRAAGLPLHDVLRWSANWYDILGILLPQPLGDRTLITNPFALLNYGSMPGQYISSLFLGPVVLTLALWGFTDRGWRIRWLVLCTAVLSGLLALGEHLSFAPYLVQFLHLSLVRFPIKLSLFTVLSIILAASRGLKLARRQLPAWPLILSALVWMLITLACSVILGCGALLGGGSAYSLAEDAGVRIASCALLMSSLALLVCLGALSVRRRKIKPAVLSSSCIAITASLLLWQSLNLRHEAPADFYQTPSWMADQLGQLATARGWQSPHRAVNMTMPINAPMEFLNRGGDANCNFYQFGRQMLLPISNFDAKVAALGGGAHEDIDIDIPERTRIFRVARWCYEQGNDRPLANYCQLTGSQAVTQYARESGEATQIAKANRYLDGKYFKLETENSFLNARIYSVKNALPRAYFCPEVKWGKPHSALVKFIDRPDVSGFDPHKLTILEHNSAQEVGPRLRGSPAQAAASSIQWLVDEPERIVLRVENQFDNFLVLADTYYPGWQAYVDSRDTEIFQADSFLRAVFVPAGDHFIEFNYRPPALALGLGMSALAIAIILGLLALDCFARSSRRNLV